MPEDKKILISYSQKNKEVTLKTQVNINGRFYHAEKIYSDIGLYGTDWVKEADDIIMKAVKTTDRKERVQ
jgi:hypothetical protein